MFCVLSFVSYYLQETELAHTQCLYCIAVCHDQGYGNTVSVTDASKAEDVFLGTGVYATAISAGLYNTCAILSNRKLLCWGWNPYGKLIHTLAHLVTLTVVDA
jgi:Regulator of chromosome condensation (RCC1) repeat